MNSDLTATAAPSNTALPLQIDSLVKRFGQVTAVDGVSLKLHGSECLGLLGPNGAGKSTLIRSIVGRVIPDAGRLAVFGFQAGSAAARTALGWVPQELAVYPRLTCKENLAAFGGFQGLDGRKLTHAITWCLEWATLQDRAGSLAKDLSGGMKRRLNMAAGIIHRPSLC
jgi:ABC-2 type transport system ATP-binding protein